MLCKTFKKGLIGAALGAGALGLIFGTAAPSYVCTAFQNARASVKSAVPIQFEIDRLRNELANLDSKVKVQIQEIVREENTVNKLRDEVATGQTKLAKEKAAIVALKSKAETGIALAGTGQVTPEDLKRVLASKFDAFTREEAVVAQRTKTLEIRERGLQTAMAGLDTLSAKKAELAARIDGIEAQLKALQASEEARGVVVDVSAVQDVENAVKDLEQRLQDKGREVELIEKYLDSAAEAGPDAAPARDVMSEIDAKFGTVPASDASSSL